MQTQCNSIPPEKSSAYRDSHPGHNPCRDKKGCAAVLVYYRSLPRNLSVRQLPTQDEMRRAGGMGKRPFNRINDLIHGKYDGHHYDFERIHLGHGDYRFRFHEPNRPGYPKTKNQTVLTLASPEPESEPQPRRRQDTLDWFEREFGKPKPSAGTTDSTTIELPLFDGGKP